MGFFRTIAVLIAVAIGLSLVRTLLGALMRWLNGPGEKAGASPKEVRSGGLLRKCPVCGTYVPEATGVKGGSAWYCSERCRQTPRLNESD